MQETILIILGTAILTALLSVGLFALYYRKVLQPDLDRQLERAGKEMEERVRQGVLSAGEELLPQFRDKVSEGLSRSLREWPTSEFSKVARSGASMVEEGLNTLFGKRRD